MTDNDPTEFVQLLMRHQGALLRYVLPLVACYEDAQDVLQDTATAIWRKFSDYDRSQPFLPWARQFARNEVLMHHRRSKRYLFLSEPLIESLLDAQSNRDVQRERRCEALQQCLEKLPTKDRMLIQQRYSNREVTIQQIAEEAGQTANMLYKLLGRIRRQLLDCIDRSLDAEAM